MKQVITLSYILTTFNKLNYLKVALPLLISACKNDEEIIIVDGGSSDGTKEYLEELFKEKKIHQFISEKDCGEAHGTNKAILLSNGELIKIITDDDAFFYPGVQECKAFMLKNDDLDVLAGNIGIMNIQDLKTITFAKNFQNNFENWQKKDMTAFFCGLSLMIRKKSIALTGLFNPDFIQIDVEFTTRITSMQKVNIAWYTNALVVAIRNPQSGSVRISEKKSYAEQKRISHFNDWEIPQHNKIGSAIELIKKILRPVKNKIRKTQYEGNKNYEIEENILNNIQIGSSEFTKAFAVADYWLQSYNKNNNPQFLLKNQTKK